MTDKNNNEHANEAESKAKQDFMDRIRRGARKGMALGSTGAAAIASTVTSAQAAGGGGCSGDVCNGGYSIPEPSTLAAYGVGLAGIAGVSLARRHAQKKKLRAEQSETDEGKQD